MSEDRPIVPFFISLDRWEKAILATDEADQDKRSRALYLVDYKLHFISSAVYSCLETE